MRNTITLILALSMVACKTSSNINNHWLALKDSFYSQNQKDFTIDSTLKANFYNNKLHRRLHSTKEKIFDSIFGSPHYLYSWQKQDTAMTAFTILSEGFGECLEIRLLTFDKLDKLTSNIIVAKLGGEPGSYSYKTESHFKTQDTFLTVHTRTYSVDELTHKKLSRIVGDTLWVRQYFDKTGKVVSQIIDSSMTSKCFKNKYGYVTEKMLTSPNF